MSQDPLGRADQIRTARVLSSECDGRPATERGALQVKEEKEAAKEAFDGTALAQFLFGPSGRQTGSIFLPLGIPRNDGDSTKHSMNPGNETQAEVRPHPGGRHGDGSDRGALHLPTGVLQKEHHVR